MMNTPKSHPGGDEPEFEADDEFEPQAPDPWRTAALAGPGLTAHDDPLAHDASFGAEAPADPLIEPAEGLLGRLFSSERLFAPESSQGGPAPAEPPPAAAFATEAEAPPEPAPNERIFSTERLFADQPPAEPHPEAPTAAYAPAEPAAADPVQPAPLQAEPPQSDSLQPDSLQAASLQAASPQAASPQAASPQAAPAAEPPHAADGSGHGDHSVPRIGIHIFFERPETAETAQSASQDRRMARASTAIRPGGVAAAVDYYQNQPTPPLIIVESLDDGHFLIEKLDQLAEVCDPGTKVLVIGSHNDIALYRELMRRGVSEYIVPPLHTLQLIRSITSLYADPSAPFVGRQIAFCGARGGVGSSTIAHNLAYTLSERMQANTVIVDFDLPFGTAGLDFNQDPLQGVVDALQQPDRLDGVLLDRMMVRCTERLSLFAAPATLDDDYDIAADAYEEVANKIRGTAPFVVLDLPHVWSNWVRRMLLGADDVVITATPDLASLRNAKNIVDLVRQARPNDAPPRLVFNQLGIPGRPEIPLKDFSDALGLELGISVPFDAKLFGQAANNGQMIEEVNAKSKAAEAMQALAQLIARRDPPPAPKKSTLSSLFRLK
jgi:pilus assembly protein CpaE